MATMNKKAPGNKTTNISGHKAYSMSTKDELVTQVLTTFFNEKKYYGDNSQKIIENIHAVIKGDPEFVAKLAVYARREFNMRTISHVICACLAHDIPTPDTKTNEVSLVRRTVRACVVRGDDATSIMAAYIDLFGKPVPNALKRGLRDALEGMKPYAIAKYQEKGKAISMRDLIRMCHPYSENSYTNEAYEACVNGTLKVPESWETELSAQGNTKEAWEKLIAENKVGYMAALRNLRNMLRVMPSNMNAILEKLTNPEEVARSRQLPFRFWSAYREIATEPNAGSAVLSALETALELSIDNLPRLSGRTIIAIDSSGSMSCRLSDKSSVSVYDTANMLGMIAAKISDDAIVYNFDTNLKQFPFSKNSTVLSQVAQNSPNGGGTNMSLPFERAIDSNIVCDRFIVLSDNEVNRGYGWYTNKTVQSLADEYRDKMSSAETWVHAIDMQGYGTQQFHGGRTNIMAGWSEKVLGFIALAELGKGDLIARIEAVSIG